MRFLLWWLGPFVARRFYRGHPLWWPVGWIAARVAVPVALAILAWTGRRLGTHIDSFLDQRMDEHRRRRSQGAPTSGVTSRPTE